MASWDLVAIGATSSVTSGNCTPGEPTGAASGDLLVCIIAYRDTAAFTAPSGWTITQQQSSGNTVSGTSSSIGSGLIAYIVRGGSAPSYAFTRTGGDAAVGRVVAYRPVGGTITFDESNSLTLGAAGTAVSMTGFTTNKADSLIVLGACHGRNTVATLFDAATDPATDSGTTTVTTAGAITTGTWRRRVSFGYSGGAQTYLGMADAVRATAGATGDLSFTSGFTHRGVIVGAAFTITASTGATLTADAGAFTLTGVAAGLTVSRCLVADAGSFALTGVDAGLLVTRSIVAETGAFTFTGNDAGLTASRVLAADTGAFTLTGMAADFTTITVYALTAATGAFTVTGVAAGLLVTQRLVAETGVFTFAGQLVNLRINGRTIDARIINLPRPDRHAHMPLRERFASTPRQSRRVHIQ